MSSCRCQPAWDLSLVVELQVSVSENTVPRSPTGQAAESPLQLTAMAWCRIPLFDATLRLCSGWWRVPLRVLPVRPELSGAGVNAVPQYEQAELLVRVANLRDADNQTNVPLDLGRLRSMYQYHDMVGRVSHIMEFAVAPLDYTVVSSFKYCALSKQV